MRRNGLSNRRLRSQKLRRRHRLAATATEYMLILAVIVLPIALMFPMLLNMIRLYCGRMVKIVQLPFP
jgi:hypothetical protein